MPIVPARNRCRLCAHEWFPRSDRPSPRCPRCHTALWDRERKRGWKRTSRQVHASASGLVEVAGTWGYEVVNG